jgi:hypothetical protein
MESSYIVLPLAELIDFSTEDYIVQHIWNTTV